MEELIYKIAKFIVNNIDKIAKWILDIIEKLVGKPLPVVKTITTVSNYLHSLSATSLEYIGRLLGI